MGEAWPVLANEAEVGVAVVCASHFNPATDMCIGAVAAILPEGARALIYSNGSSVDAIMHQMKKPGSLFSSASRQALSSSLSFVAIRGHEQAVMKTLKDYWQKMTISLPISASSGSTSSTISAKGAERKWYVYPGLFAGGSLDVMTAFFLGRIRHYFSESTTAVRMCDFCCGSGSIAATFSAWVPRAAVDCLDADAVALGRHERM